MSVPQLGRARRECDAYFTPDHVAAACVATLSPALAGATVLEPSCGAGAFVRAALDAGAARVVALDLEPQLPGDLLDHPRVTIQRGDSLVVGPRVPVDVVVGNPPYKGILDHLDRALSHGAQVVGQLVPLSTLASAGRQAWWREHPPAEVHVLSSRPSFTGDGKTDGRDYAWVVWRQQPVADRPAIGWIL